MDEGQELRWTTELKLTLRYAIASQTGLLTRAYRAGLFQARNEGDRAILTQAGELLGSPAPGTQTHPGATLLLAAGDNPASDRWQPDGDHESDLTPLSDDEYLDVFYPLKDRWDCLTAMYDRGMAVATTDEGHRLLVQVQDMLGAPDLAGDR